MRITVMKIELDDYDLPNFGFYGLVAEFEKALLKAAIKYTSNNSEAAKLLNLGRTTFIEKVKKHGITPKTRGIRRFKLRNGALSYDKLV